MTKNTNYTNLHEDEKNELYDDKEIFEAFDSFETALEAFTSINLGKGSYDDEEETFNLKSLFECITRVKAAITSASAHAVEGSEMSDIWRTGLQAMNTWLYIAVATSDAWCFIREGILKIVEVINEDEEENEEENEEEEDCCAICLEGMKSGDVKGSIEHCDHSFHFVCLNQWMKRMHTCPLCRFEVDGRLINVGDHVKRRRLEY